MKPIIGITTSLMPLDDANFGGEHRVYVNDDYVQAIIKAGGIPMILPATDDMELINKYIDMCHGFLFSGGADINPIYYHKEPHKNLGSTNSRLDDYQITLCKAILKEDKAFLGICRGMQVLNVALGGTLFQDLDEIPQATYKHVQNGKRYDLCHKVFFKKHSLLDEIFGEEIYINSFHHQCIDSLGQGLEIIAKAKDDVVEAVHIKDRNFVLGVQWHPEMLLSHSDSMLPLFKKFIEKASCK